jgi:arylsulfatase A-like enzyme
VLLRGAASPRQVVPYFRNGTLTAWRSGPWKLHRYETTGRQVARARELDPPTLYNLAHDPGERFDRAASEPAVVERLRKEAAAFEQSIDKRAPEFDRVSAAPESR